MSGIAVTPVKGGQPEIKVTFRFEPHAERYAKQWDGRLALDCTGGHQYRTQRPTGSEIGPLNRVVRAIRSPSQNVGPTNTTYSTAHRRLVLRVMLAILAVWSRVPTLP